MRDEYLTTEELMALKSILYEHLESLMSQSQEAVSALTALLENDPDPLDLAVTESNRDFTLRLADRERRLVSKIKHSMERMNAGEYGVCESCGDAITFPRLMARPVATLCIDCKTEAEQLEPRKKIF